MSKKRPCPCEISGPSFLIVSKQGDRISCLDLSVVYLSGHKDGNVVVPYWMSWEYVCPRDGVFPLKLLQLNDQEIRCSCEVEPS